MSETGMSRHIDDLGRFVLPAEIRKSFGLKEGDRLDITVDDGRIILSVVVDKCVFCRSATELREFQDKLVCGRCVSDLTAGDTGSTWEPFAP